jgi:hypothetical protein
LPNPCSATDSPTIQQNWNSVREHGHFGPSALSGEET